MDTSGTCRDLVSILTRLGGEVVTPSTGGMKALVDKGIWTTIVGPKPVDEPILGLHPWLLGDPMFKGMYISDGVATR